MYFLKKCFGVFLFGKTFTRLLIRGGRKHILMIPNTFVQTASDTTTMLCD